MQVDKSGRIQSEKLGIDDANPSTEGGAPKWLALAVVGGIFLAAAAVIAVIASFVIG